MKGKLSYYLRRLPFLYVNKRGEEVNIYVNLLGFYFKSLSRSIFYLVTILFGFFILISRFIVRQFDKFQLQNYGDFLGETGLITQGLILCYMVYFYKIFSEELKYGVQSFFVNSYSILLKKIGALLTVHVLIQLVILLIQILLIYIFYRVWSIPYSSFYIDSAIFLFNYMFIPLLIGSLLGILIATMLGRSKLSIVVILLVWVLLGPLNTELFRDYFRSIPIGDIKSFWQLGVSNSERVFISYNGFELSKMNFYKNIIFLILNFVFLLFVLLKWNTKSGVKLKVFISGIVAVIFVTVIGNQVLKSSDNMLFSYADYHTERDFYKEPFENKTFQIEPYQIEGYHIMLNFKEYYNAQVEIEISKPKSRELNFTLYHGYEMKSLKDNMNRELNYQHLGDYVEIQLVDENIESITFTYAIKASPSILFEKRNKYLPAYTSWIPTQGKKQLFYDDRIGNRLMTNVQSKNMDVKYSMKVEGTEGNPIITNLNEVDHNKFEGVSNGVTLLQGNFLSYETPEGIEVIYPNDWRNIRKDWTEFKKIATLILVEGNAILGDELIPTNLPKLIIFDSTQNISFISADSLIMNLDSLYSLSSPLTLQYLSQELLKVMTEHMEGIEEDAYNNWLNLSSLFIRLQLDVESEGAFFVEAYYPEEYSYVSTEEKSSIKYVYNHFFELDLQQQREFLKEWYRQLSLIDNNWLAVEELMIEVGENK